MLEWIWSAWKKKPPVVAAPPDVTLASPVGLRLLWGSESVVGNVRENNEDRCYTDTQGRFFLVADGMGGQSAGEKASEMAVTGLAQQFESMRLDQEFTDEAVARKLDEVVHTVNDEILSLSDQNEEYHNMGTTVVAAVHAGRKLHLTGVGDSRAYCWRHGELRRLTKDHSITEALVESGAITREEAAKHKYRHMLYLYLGCREQGWKAPTYTVGLQAGDRFVLCSDGVTDGLDEPRLAEVVAQGTEPQATASAIVEAALQGGSKDNVTCVVVFVETEPASA